MQFHKAVHGSLFALTSLALVSLAGTARADYLGDSKSGSFGSGNIMAGYSGSAGLTYCSAARLAEATTAKTCILSLFGSCMMWIPKYPECLVGATEQYASAAASGGGWVELFGTRKSITVKTSATTADGSSSLNFNVTAFGYTLINTSATSIPLITGMSFGASKDFSIAGVSVEVSGEAGAFIGAYISGGAISNGFKATVTPTISAGVEASASVGVLCASAGIEGSVDALDVELPTSLSVAYSNGQLTFGIDGDLNYSALSGSLKAKACLCGACDSTTIASYGGFGGDISLFSSSSTISL